VNDPPVDYGDADTEIVAGLPATASVQHVLLQQREERFHGGVVAG